MRKALRIPALAAASTLVALAAGEVWVRTARPVPYRKPVERLSPEAWSSLVHGKSAIPGLAYELRPGVEREVDGILVCTNRHGMRDDEILDPRPAGTRRIAVLGDSVTFGLNVAGEEAWPNVAERELDAAPAAPGERYEVLNCGVTGYSSRDEAALLEHRILRLDPDLVVIGYYLNDPEVEPVQQLQLQFHETETWERSALLRFLAFQRRKIGLARNGGDPLRFLNDPAGSSWRSVPAAFARIRELTRARGIPALVYVLPTLYGARRAIEVDGREELAPVPAGSTEWSRFEDYPYRAIHARVAAAAREAGLAVDDPLEDLQASGWSPSRLMSDFDHPNAAGHRLLGEHFARVLRERDSELLGAGPRGPDRRGPGRRGPDRRGPGR